MADTYTSGNSRLIPHLRNYIVDKVEKESHLEILEQMYAIIDTSSDSFTEKYRRAKEQCERFCTPELARELEEEGYMIGKPDPNDDSNLDIDHLIEEDAQDDKAPQEWVEKMFPELYS